MSGQNNMVKRTLLNSLVNLSSFAVAVIVALLLIPFIVEEIGLEKYGIYGLFIALLGPLGITNIGFNQASIKYISEFHGKGDFERINQYFQTNLVLVFLMGLVGSLLMYFFGFELIKYFFLIDSSDHELIQSCLIYVSLMWFIGQLNNVLSAVPIAFQRFIYLGAGNVSLTLINAVLVVLLIDQGLEGLLIAYCIGNASLLLIWVLFIRRFAPQIQFRFRIHREALKKTSVFAGWQTFGQVGSILSSQAEKYLIGALFTKVTLGIYIIAHDLHAKLYLPIYKLFEVLFPLFSALGSGEEQSMRQRILSKSSWFSNVLAASIMIPFIPIIPSFLSLWISPEMSALGSPILEALLISAAISACSLPLIMYYNGNAKARFIAITTLIGGLISVVTAYTLLSKFDIRYAGYGALLAFLVRHLIYLGRIKMMEKDFAWKELLNVSIIPIGTAIALNLFIANSFDIQLNGWFSIIGFYCLMFLGSLLSISIVAFITDDWRSRIKDFKTLYQHTLKKI